MYNENDGWPSSSDEGSRKPDSLKIRSCKLLEAAAQHGFDFLGGFSDAWLTTSQEDSYHILTV